MKNKFQKLNMNKFSKISENGIANIKGGKPITDIMAWCLSPEYACTSTTENDKDCCED